MCNGDNMNVEISYTEQKQCTNVPRLFLEYHCGYCFHSTIPLSTFRIIIHVGMWRCGDAVAVAGRDDPADCYL